MTTTTAERFTLNEKVSASTLTRKLKAAGFEHHAEYYNGFKTEQVKTSMYAHADYATIEVMSNDLEEQLKVIGDIQVFLVAEGYYTKLHVFSNNCYLDVRSENPELTALKVKVLQAENALRKAQEELANYNDGIK